MRSLSLINQMVAVAARCHALSNVMTGMVGKILACLTVKRRIMTFSVVIMTLSHWGPEGFVKISGPEVGPD